MNSLGVNLALAFFCCGSLLGQTSVLTQHNDLSRTGQNLTETILTPTTVSSGSFGKIFSLGVDGVVEAQPLYLPALGIASARHNVVFIATEHDSVYAFDADLGGSPLWHASLLDAAHGAATGATPNPDSTSGCYITNDEYGISGTPVIDPGSGTLYLVAATYENNFPVTRLHALDTTTGAEKFGGPVTISASIPGTGNGSSNGTLSFNPNFQNQRAGLALVNGIVYIAFAAYCDLNAYHGWMFAYNAATLARTSVLLTSPNGVDSGIWMGAAAPSFDTANGLSRMFITTGNGSYDMADNGDSILRLDLANGMLVADSFTPYNQAYLSSTDTDLGSSGVLILPDQPGTYPHLLIEASKAGDIYLVNRDSLGGYGQTANNVVQELDGAVGSSFGLPAYWNGNLYLWASADSLKQFTVTNGLVSSSPIASSTQTQVAGLGSTPSISANGNRNAIVWSIDASQATQILYAHDATNISNTLWSGDAGPKVKFSFPTIVNGKIYVASVGHVLVYGLPDYSLSNSTGSISLAQGQTATDSINITPLYGFNSSITFTASGLPPGVTASFTTSATASVATFTASANTDAGTYTVTITGTSGTQSHTVTANLAVAAADFTVAANPTALTMAAGTSSTALITVTPGNLFGGSITFTCSVAGTLANVTCSIPGTVSNGSGSAMLTVSAASNATAPFTNPPIYPLTCLLLIGCAVVMLSHSKGRLLATGLAVLLMLALGSCGGGGSTSTTITTKTSGETGLVTIVGTSGALSHTTSVSVTIQ